MTDTKASARADHFIRDAVSRALENGSVRLPPIASLAKQAGVSPVTMWKAVSQCKAQGIITVGPRTGIRLCTARPDTITPLQPLRNIRPLTAKWREMARLLSRDLLAGVYPPGSVLPSTKELLHRYGTNYRTLRKVLAALCGDGLVCPHGIRFAVPSLGGRASATVVLIAREGEQGYRLGFGPRMGDNVRFLEQECARARVKLHIAPFSHSKPDPARFLRRDEAVVGYLVWATSIAPHYASLLLKVIAAQRKPAALLDEKGVAFSVLDRKITGKARLFSLGLGPVCGSTMGRYLIGLGHRRIAYFAGGLTSAASDDRAAGLAHAAELAGCPGAVRVFTPSRTDAENAGGADTAARRIVESLAPHMTAGRDRTEAYTQVSAAPRRMVAELLAQKQRWDALVPQFEAALADRSITAWVGYNDETALLCLEYLHSRRREVPGEISVTGFDDTAAASAAGLTSYNFNGVATMRAMLAYVLNPRGRLPCHEPGDIIGLDGFITERDTAASAAGGPV